MCERCLKCRVSSHSCLPSWPGSCLLCYLFSVSNCADTEFRSPNPPGQRAATEDHYCVGGATCSFPPLNTPPEAIACERLNIRADSLPNCSSGSGVSWAASAVKLRVGEEWSVLLVCRRTSAALYSAFWVCVKLYDPSCVFSPWLLLLHFPLGLWLNKTLVEICQLVEMFLPQLTAHVFAPTMLLFAKTCITTAFQWASVQAYFFTFCAEWYMNIDPSVTSGLHE